MLRMLQCHPTSVARVPRLSLTLALDLPRASPRVLAGRDVQQCQEHGVQEQELRERHYRGEPSAVVNCCMEMERVSVIT